MVEVDAVAAAVVAAATAADVVVEVAVVGQVVVTNDVILDRALRAETNARESQ